MRQALCKCSLLLFLPLLVTPSAAGTLGEFRMWVAVVSSSPILKLADPTRINRKKNAILSFHDLATKSLNKGAKSVVPLNEITYWARWPLPAPEPTANF